MKISTCALLLAFLTLAGCNFGKDNDKNKKAAKKPVLQESSEVDFQSFLGILRLAAKAHDVNALASMMTEDFGYRMSPEGAGAGVFQYWDENDLWPELSLILSEKFVKKGNFMVAPPQFADETTNYDGYRAGIVRVNGSWKFAYFVNG
jgi:hypothetical protein